MDWSTSGECRQSNISYFLLQQLQNKIDSKKENLPTGVTVEAKQLVNEYIVKNLHRTSNQLFSQNPIQSVKNFFDEQSK